MLNCDVCSKKCRRATDGIFCTEFKEVPQIDICGAFEQAESQSKELQHRRTGSYHWLPEGSNPDNEPQNNVVLKP